MEPIYGNITHPGGLERPLDFVRLAVGLSQHGRELIRLDRK